MLKLTGRIIAKTLIKEGESSYGKWQLVQFIIVKQHNKEKKKIVFTALGKIANQVQDIQLKERITVYFEPKCNEYNNRWFTELKATEVVKYIKKDKTWFARQEGAEPLIEIDYTLTKNNQLFRNEDF